MTETQIPTFVRKNININNVLDINKNKITKSIEEMILTELQHHLPQYEIEIDDILISLLNDTLEGMIDDIIYRHETKEEMLKKDRT